MSPKNKFSFTFWVLTIVGIVVFLAGTFLITKIFPSSTPESIENKNYSVEKVTSSVKIISPKGGEIFSKGGTYKLRWNGGEEKINILLIDKALENLGVSASIAQEVYDIKNTGSYDFSFSKKLPTGTYRLEIGNSDTDYFKVEP